LPSPLRVVCVPYGCWMCKPTYFVLAVIAIDGQVDSEPWQTEA
jgi:hypothetical protein